MMPSLEKGFGGQKHYFKAKNCLVLKFFRPEYRHFTWSDPGPMKIEAFVKRREELLLQQGVPGSMNIEFVLLMVNAMLLCLE